MYEHTKAVPVEIILVDNASVETDPEEFKKVFPEIVLVKNSTNTGFAGGNNAGIAKAKGDLLLLLNSDTYLTEDAIGKAAAWFASLKNPGALGVKMKYPDGALQHTARRFRSISWELLDLFRFIPMLMPYKKKARLMLGKYFNADFNCACDWVNGAFFLFSKELLQILPGNKLDDRFFMYAEDHLWCWQFHKSGYQNYFYCETSIVHINNASTKQEKRLSLLKTMFQHELVIMRERKGKSLYYFFFWLIYGVKEWGRFWVKSFVLRITGEMMR